MTPPEQPAPPSGFSIFRLAIDRPVAVTMLTLGVVVFGAVAYGRLQVALMPRFSHPTLTVRAQYPGSAPEEVEQFVTAPLEKAVSIVSGLREVRSLSRAGLAEVVLEFQWGTDLGLATLEVRERLDRLVFPDEVEKPILLRFDPDEEPIVRMALVGPPPLSALRDLAEQELKPQLQTTPGVAFVQVRGGAPPEVIVELDEGRLARLGLSVAQVAARLNAENINLAGGVLREGRTEYRVRTLNELGSLEELAAVPISPRGAPIVRLRDIATVRLGEGPVAVHARVDGQRAVELEVFKEADANVVEVAARVRAKVWGGDPALAGAAQEEDEEGGSGQSTGRRRAPPLAETLGEERALRLIADRSAFIEAALDEVRKTALQGALLAMVVLFLFLGRLRSTLFVVAAIPLSLIAAFLLMFALDITLNMISLGGLALGVGMLVDNAIVVLESIHRLREQGRPPHAAALEGVREVGGAVTASTLTTVAVFLPLVFVEGVAGQLFGDLALTVVFSLLASLVVALYFLPMLYVHVGEGGAAATAAGWAGLRTGAAEQGRALRRVAARLGEGGWITRVAAAPYRLARLLLAVVGLLAGALPWLVTAAAVGLRRLAAGVGRTRAAGALGWGVGRFAVGVERLTVGYSRALAGALARPGWVVAAAAAAFLVSMGWSGRLEQELISPLHQGVLLVRMELPPGTPLAATSETAARLEAQVAGALPGATTYARIGEEPDSQSAEQGGENVALIWVTLAATAHLAAAEAAAAETLRDLLGRLPDVTYRVRPPPLFTLRPPIEVEVRGNRLELLAEGAARVTDVMGRLPGLEEVKSHFRQGSPEIQLLFNRDRLAQAGLTARGVAELVRDKLEGETSLRFRTVDQRVDVRLRVREPQLDSLAELAALSVNPGGAAPLPLSSVAELRQGEGPTEIRRVAQHRTALITATVRGNDLKRAVAETETALAGIALPEGITLAFTGQSEEMTRSLRSLFLALALAIFLVYLVMASQFESLVQPVVILLAVPLAGIGVVWVLWAAGQTLDVLVGIGLIVLVGIVVNNAIVLVNTVNRLARAGTAPLEALLTAARIRLRPILMTTATTVLGLVPLVLDPGAGVEIRRPIALTIIAGLFTSMVLILLVVPCALRLLHRATWSNVNSLYH